MKSFLKHFLVVACSVVTLWIGAIATIVYAVTDLSVWYVWIPALVISWIILFPVWEYWKAVFSSLFNYDERDKA